MPPTLETPRRHFSHYEGCQIQLWGFADGRWGWLVPGFRGGSGVEATRDAAINQAMLQIDAANEAGE